jgi:hypothetical protein
MGAARGPFEQSNHTISHFLVLRDPMTNTLHLVRIDQKMCGAEIMKIARTSTCKQNCMRDSAAVGRWRTIMWVDGRQLNGQLMRARERGASKQSNSKGGWQFENKNQSRSEV